MDRLLCNYEPIVNKSAWFASLEKVFFCSSVLGYFAFAFWPMFSFLCTCGPGQNHFTTESRWVPQLDTCMSQNFFLFSGELAEIFSVLVRVLHSGQFKCVSPNEFKRTIGKFKSQFSGYDQQDSQELLAFLMDGLHEDLNKVNSALSAFSLSGYCPGWHSGQVAQWLHNRRGILAAPPLSPKGYEEATMAAAAKASLRYKS